MQYTSQQIITKREGKFRYATKILYINHLQNISDIQNITLCE